MMSFGVLNNYFDSKQVAEFLVFDFSKTNQAGVVHLYDGDKVYGWFTLTHFGNDEIGNNPINITGASKIGQNMLFTYEISKDDAKRLDKSIRLHKRVSRLLNARYNPTILNRIGVWI